MRYKINLDPNQANYVIMRGEYVVSGVYSIYENALEETQKRIERRRGDGLPAFRIVELRVMEKTVYTQEEEE